MTMFRPWLTKVPVRFYSNFKESTKDNPVVKLLSKDAKLILKKRLDRQAEKTATDQKGIDTYFEPFPFKVTEDNRLATLKNIVMPLHDVPLEEQLIGKVTNCKRGLRMLAQELYRAGTPIRQDVNRLPCTMKPIVVSPTMEHYRSTDEFSIWKGIDREKVTVGYMVFPLSKHGDTVCVQPDGVAVMKPETVELSHLLQEFIESHRKLPICYSLGHEGGWRRFASKSNESGEYMLIGIISPRNITIAEYQAETDNFKEFMVKRCEEVGIKLASLYVQPCPFNRCTQKQAPYELQHGSPLITQKIGGLSILLSPESYIHPNIAAYERFLEELNNTILDCFEFSEDKKPIIIDLQCRSGTTSLHMSKIASKVIAIDKGYREIKDAINNSKINDVKNCRFVCAEPEIVIERVLDRFRKSEDEIVVVLNATKSGLNAFVADAIRNSETIKKVIYITPKLDHDNCQKDLVRLCVKSSKPDSTKPFLPIQATPFDLLPHCELSDVMVALHRAS